MSTDATALPLRQAAAECFPARPMRYDSASGPPANVAEARRVVESFVAHYDEVRLHSALCYITPQDKLAGREP